MLRHYDALGLVCPSARTTGGYRRYSPSDIERLLHVESLRSLGLSLAEVKRALDDAEFSPPVVIGELIEQSRQRLAREQELISRLRHVQATESNDWSDVLGIVGLLRSLRSAHAPHRQQAVLHAAHRGALPAAALAESLLTEDETNVAGTLHWALARAGEEALPVLSRGLHAERPEVRRRTVEAITALTSPAATALLREALGDPDDVVRSRAAIALGRRGDDTATAVLIALIADGADGIDDVAAGEALGHLASDKKRAAGIVADLVAHAANAPSPVRRRVVQALAELPATAARPALEPFTRDPEPGVALTAVALLRRLDS